MKNTGTVSIGRLTVSYDADDSLTLYQAMIALAHGAYLLRELQGEYTITRMATAATGETRFWTWDTSESRWDKNGQTYIFIAPDDNASYYSADYLGIRPLAWYEQPNAFDAPVHCLVSEVPIPENALLVGDVRRVIGYDDKKKRFITYQCTSSGIERPSMVTAWEYALPLTTITG